MPALRHIKKGSTVFIVALVDWAEEVLFTRIYDSANRLDAIFAAITESGLCSPPPSTWAAEDLIREWLSHEGIELEIIEIKEVT